jgi:acetyltransferase
VYYYEEHCVPDAPRLRTADRILDHPAGPRVQLDWVDQLDIRFRDSLGLLWLDVLRSGGAIGFRPIESADIVFRSVDRLVGAAASGAHHLLRAQLNGRLVGCLTLTPGRNGVDCHSGLISRVMVCPRHQRCGLGTTLLTEAAAHARRLGMEQLLLSLRDGEGLSAFYCRRGWVEVGRWPDGIEIAAGERRDEVWFQRHV